MLIFNLPTDWPFSMLQQIKQYMWKKSTYTQDYSRQKLKWSDISKTRIWAYTHGINPNKKCGVTSQPVGSLQEYCGTKHNESRFGVWQRLFTKI